MQEYLTLREVANYLRVSIATVKRYTRIGDLDYVRVNKRGDKRIPKESLEEMVKRNSKKFIK